MADAEFLAQNKIDLDSLNQAADSKYTKQEARAISILKAVSNARHDRQFCSASTPTP